MNFITPVLFSFTYIVFFYLFGLFFEKEVSFSKKSIISLIIIAILSFTTYEIAFMIPSLEIGNRFLHGVGGGFISSLLSFLVFKDTKIQVSKFQFFFFTFLIVSTLGVFNEILEFFLQNYAHKIFAINSKDTWLDLISNTVGAIISSLVLMNFIKRDKPILK
ncbi:TPA: hypothetical protein DIC38_01530 [Candidatus Nomurabacteria bacterium]|nr:MAG: hypothetical protein O210_OD1C00001G0426 [Parcubacteria bacterium RAAC4_OD1_1]HCY26342.1 hypothetical protein [Candidatus Nomurabacteria bacterium]